MREGWPLIETIAVALVGAPGHQLDQDEVLRLVQPRTMWRPPGWSSTGAPDPEQKHNPDASLMWAVSQVDAARGLERAAVEHQVGDDACGVAERDRRRPTQMGGEGIGPAGLPHDRDAGGGADR